jgi:acyl-coenzyme A synthetase/AMP-(fatty) acid ligase
MPAMPSSPTRELHDRLLATLQASPARDVARLLPGGEGLDLDSFERRILGAERRIVRIGQANGAGAAVEPDAGQVIALSARNSASWLVAMATLWKRGFAPLLTDADLARAEIAELARQVRPAAVILDRRADPEGGRSEDLGDSLPGLHAWIPPRRAGREPLRLGATASGAGAAATGAGAAAAGVPGISPRAAVLRMTSGTTGRPRPVVVTVEQLLADSRNITGTMGIRPQDAMVAAIPLGHAYGFVHVFISLVTQGTRPVILEQPLPALLVEALSGPGPLVMAGTPYLFELILQAAGRRRFKGLRLALSAGAPLPERLSRAFTDRFGVPIRTFYGATECGGIAYDRSRSGVVPDGCVGTPLDGVRVTIEPVVGVDGGAGRIAVHGEAVADGYLPPEAKGAIRPGRFLTSDLGRLGEDGALRLEGRLDRMINVGGRKVNPAEVEAVLRSVPGVRDAVVFGIPDRHRGEAVCAGVVAGRPVTRQTLLAACADRLAPFKIPRHLEFLDRLPVTARGKTDRGALAGMIGRGAGGSAAAGAAAGSALVAAPRTAAGRVRPVRPAGGRATPPRWRT